MPLTQRPFPTQLKTHFNFEEFLSNTETGKSEKYIQKYDIREMDSETMWRETLANTGWGIYWEQWEGIDRVGS